MESDSDIDPIDECREWVVKSIGDIVKRVNEIKQCQENLESRVSTLETSLNTNNEEVQEKLDGTNAEIGKQSKRISVLETSDTVTNDVLKQQEKSLSELNSNTSKLDGRIHNLETSVNKIDQSIAATNTTMEHQDKRISEMESGNSQSELLNTFILGGINELKKNTTCENLIRDNLDLMDQDLSNVKDVLVGMRGMSTPNTSSVLSYQGVMGTQGAVRTEPEEAVPVSRQTGAAVTIDVAEVEIGEGVVRTEKVSSEQAPCTSGTAPSDDDVQIIGISEQGPNTSGTVPNDDDIEIIRIVLHYI